MKIINYIKGVNTLFLLGFFLIIFLFIFVGCTADNKFKREVEIEKAAVKFTQEVLRGNYNVIATTNLKEKLDSNQPMLLIDAMPYEAGYQKNHIPTAKQFLFPIPEMREWNTKDTGGKTKTDFLVLLGEDKSRMIVVYCGFVKCTRSHNGALWAVKLGYTNVYRYPGGVFAWKGAGYPLNSVK